MIESFNPFVYVGIKGIKYGFPKDVKLFKLIVKYINAKVIPIIPDREAAIMNIRR